MSYIIAPDLHPGRCPNTQQGPPPFFESLRCVDYAGVPHVCAFPKPRPALQPMTYTTPKPKRWIKPT